jgi:hypothetical protein
MAVLSSLGELRSELTGDDVLSVYIAADEHDPAERSSWRLRLASALDQVQRTVQPESIDAFAAARSHVEEGLEAFRGYLPGRGWVAFATVDALRHSMQLPAPMPDLVRWRRGPVLAPYLRALKQNRPIMIALVDARHARLLHYRGGEMTEDSDMRADRWIDDLSDRNMSKRAGTHSGVRGVTCTDAAERVLSRETELLLKDVARQLLAAGDSALLVIAGPTAAVALLQKLLEPVAGARLIIEPSLHLRMSTAEVRPVLERAVSDQTQRLQLDEVSDVVERTGAGGRGALGTQPVRHACEHGQVERLIVTQRFMESFSEDVEALIAATVEHAGDAELVGGPAAELLDEAGAGVGALLRYARNA